MFKEPEVPFATYNHILFKCFDTCVRDFNNKMISKIEGDCVKDCSSNLRDSATAFQNAQMY